MLSMWEKRWISYSLNEEVRKEALLHHHAWTHTCTHTADCTFISRKFVSLKCALMQQRIPEGLHGLLTCKDNKVGTSRLFILLLYGADHFSGSYHYPTGKMESDNVCVDDSAAAFAYYSLWHSVWFPLFWLYVCGTNWRLMLLHDFLLCPWTFLYVSLEDVFK